MQDLLFRTQYQSVQYVAFLRIIRYLHDTITRRLLLPSSSSLELQAYSDVDWAGEPTIHRYIVRLCIFPRGSLFSWRVRKKDVVSKSSSNVENIKLCPLLLQRFSSFAICWKRWVFTSLLLNLYSVTTRVPSRLPIILLSTSVCGLSFCQVTLSCSQVALPYIPSCFQIANFFTKITTSHTL